MAPMLPAALRGINRTWQVIDTHPDDPLSALRAPPCARGPRSRPPALVPGDRPGSGGYHRAADALHLTQPAVSRHIRRLEDQLGEPLFSSRGRGVELTPYGERAAQELRDVLAAHDRALARLGRGDDGDPFVLGTIENLVKTVLPELIAATRAELGQPTAAARRPSARSSIACAGSRSTRP